MLIHLFANRDAIKDNKPELVWIIRTVGKTIFAKRVIIDCIGVSVFNPDPEVRPNAYLEFEAEIKEGDRGEYAIVPVNDGKSTKTV